jgi:cytochrome c oxidase subunit 2
VKSNALRAALALPLLAALAGCSAVLPLGATVQAHEMRSVWVVFFWTAVFVAAVVWGLIAICLILWRQKRDGDDLPPQFDHNNALEITWTLIPLVMVLGLFAYTYVAERHVEALSPNPGLRVDVTAFRWGWHFRYPDLGIDVPERANHPPQLMLPLGETVAFDVHSADVAHSFSVPAFLFKRDAIPGIDNRFDWTPTTAGTFLGECGEFCGLNHALMTFTVAVVPRAQFTAWVARRRALATAARPGSVAGPS